MGFEVIDWPQVHDQLSEATPSATPLSSVTEPNSTTVTSESGSLTRQSAEAVSTESDNFIIVNPTIASTSTMSRATTAEATPSVTPLSAAAGNTTSNTSATSESVSPSWQSGEATPSDPLLAFVMVDHSDVPAASTLAGTDSDSDFEELPEGWEQRLVSFSTLLYYKIKII